ncbi:MAG: DUF697 domain-containing protein [Sphingobacteriales bacterium]|nr:MAG: DUF697 domain-containing protein [Sphingobacteriales bacterium]
MTEEEKRHRKATDLITHHVILSMGTAIIPVPMADILALTTLQIRMLKELCDLYEKPYSKQVAQNIITAIAGNSLARLGASLLKTIPGIGTIIGGVSAVILSGASTYAIGKVFLHNFDAGISPEEIDLDEAEVLYGSEFEAGKEVAAQLENELAVDQKDSELEKLKVLKSHIHKLETLELIKELGGLNEQGFISDEEFKAKKQELLDSI